MAAPDPSAISFQTKTDAEITRRSADFHPSIWGDYFLKYASESDELDGNTEQQLQKMKGEVKRMLSVVPATTTSPHNVELIDAIQRLGISYHFESEISEILGQMKKIVLEVGFQNDDLYTTSLMFRLLRQEGYNISNDVFMKFTNDEGKFKDALSSDARGMLGLYEAAHFLVHGKPILDEALAFTTAYLKSVATSSDLSPFLAAQVKRALKQPIRKGWPRVETKHFISIYHEDPSHSEELLRFAKLDFNFVQKLHRKEIGDATRWWTDLDFKSKLPYARDRLVEGYTWVMGAYFEPKYALARRILSKVFFLLSIIDDTYDVHGTLEELQAFKDAVQRWDISCLDQLPEYMKHCYRFLLDEYEEIEELTVKEGQRPYLIHCAKERMKKQVQSYFDEAEWFYKKYIPTVEEYMQVATVSCGYSMVIIGSFLGMGDIKADEAFEWFSNHPKIIQAASVICRLMDDVAGHKFEQKRGHVASCVECYVKQFGVTEEEAYMKFSNQVAELWKDINEECLEPRDAPMALLMRVVNLARTMDVLYKNEYPYTVSGGIMKDLIKSLFVDPIPV